MENKLSISMEDVIDIMSAYGVNSIDEIVEISTGFANENYKVSTSSANYLLRICKEQTIAMIHYELKLMNTLKSIDFPTAYPIQRNDRKYITELAIGNVVLYEFKRGKEPKLNEDTVSEIARTLAKLNAIENWKEHLKPNVVNLADSKLLINNFENLDYQYPSIFDKFQKMVAFLDAPLSIDLSKGLVHADLFPDNTLFKGDKLQAIIDFEEACVDHVLFDVGMTINGFCFINNKLDIPLFKQFIKSYVAIRPLEPKEYELLYFYIIWGAVGMSYWHLRHLTKRPYKKQEDRVEELLNRAEYFKKHFTPKQISDLAKSINMSEKFSIQGVGFDQLTQKFETPLYVYDGEKIATQLNNFKSAFKGVNLQIKYAVKALSNLSVLKYMKTLGTGIDTVTIQEIHMALKVGFKPEQIVFTPNVVDFKYIKEAVELGVAINIENITNLIKFGKEYGNSVPCCIRLNPNIIFDLQKEEEEHLNRSNINKEHYSKIDDDRMAIWYKQSKFGISLSQYQELKDIVKKYDIKVNGLHIHASHVIMDSSTFIKNAEMLFKLSEDFNDIEYFDFGGGLMVPHKPDDVVIDLKEIGDKFLPIYEEFCKKKGREIQVWFEPGRYLVSEAGCLLTKVELLKTNGIYNFAGVDTGFHHLIRPMMYDAYHSIKNASNPSGEAQKYTIVGNLCEIDNLATDRMIPTIRENDILVIENAGAYGFSMASNYNSNYRPAEVLVIEGTPHLIRKRECYDDLLRNQIVLDL